MKKTRKNTKIKEEAFAEFKELAYLHEHFLEYDEAKKAEISLRWVVFMKKYKEVFKFTDEQVAQIEERYNNRVKISEKIEQLEVELKKARADFAKSVENFDDQTFESLNKDSKPVISPFSVPKKHDSH